MGSDLNWLLDDGPLGHLASIVEIKQVDKWASGRISAASTTLDSVRSSAGATRTAALINAPTYDGRLAVSECLVKHGGDDPAAEILLQLHPDLGNTTNLAEREAMAWCLVHSDDAVFVTSDKRAALTALAELGCGRVAHPFDVWLDLLDLGWIKSEQFSKLCWLTRKHDQGLERMPSRVSSLLPLG